MATAPLPILPAVVGGSGAVTYESSDESVATIQAGTNLVSIVGAGTTITASKAEDDNYLGRQADRNLNIAP